MTTGETIVEKYTRLALESLAQAGHQLMSGEKLKASANLWKAADHALTAVCENRGWPHGELSEAVAALNRLGEEVGDPSVRMVYLLAEDCGANATYDFMKRRDLFDYHEDIRKMVDSFLAL